MFFQALAQLEPAQAFRVWYIVSLLVYALTLSLLWRAYPGSVNLLRLGWIANLAGLWHTLELGQIYMPLLLAATGAWLFLHRRRDLPAGVLIGLLVAIKPSFAIWPALLLLAGYGMTALAALACAAAVSLVPLLAYGPRIYLQWLAATAAYNGIAIPLNGSLAGMAAHMGLPWLGTVLAAALLLALALWARRCRPGRLQLSGLAIAATLLASPLSWPGYSLFLLSVLWSRSWRAPLRVAALLFVFPVWLVLRWCGNAHWQLLTLGWLYGWASLLVLGALAVETWQRGTPSLQVKES